MDRCVAVEVRDSALKHFITKWNLFFFLTPVVCVLYKECVEQEFVNHTAPLHYNVFVFMGLSVSVYSRR